MTLYKLVRDINILNEKNRLDEVSTVILDYDMPEMNGLDFSKNHLHLTCKKILLTGQSIEPEVIEGFNSKLIDRYLKKGTANIDCKINEHINELMESFFINISSPIRSHLEADRKLPIADPVFIRCFQNFCCDNNIVEYYLVDRNGSYRCFNKNGESIIFLVHTKLSLDRWVTLNQEKCSAVLAQVRERKKIPFFGVGKEAWEAPEEPWGNYLHVPEKLLGAETYYIACIQVDEGGEIK